MACRLFAGRLRCRYHTGKGELGMKGGHYEKLKRALASTTATTPWLGSTVLHRWAKHSLTKTPSCDSTGLYTSSFVFSSSNL